MSCDQPNRFKPCPAVEAINRKTEENIKDLEEKVARLYQILKDVDDRCPGIFKDGTF